MATATVETLQFQAETRQLLDRTQHDRYLVWHQAFAQKGVEFFRRGRVSARFYNVGRGWNLPQPRIRIPTPPTRIPKRRRILLNRR